MTQKVEKPAPARSPTFHTREGGALYYGNAYLFHPSLHEGIDLKKVLVKLVRSRAVKSEEQAVLAVARALEQANQAGWSEGHTAAQYE